MKSHILFVLLFVGFCIQTNGQTYYSPEEDINVNLTITIKEPYKPINYSEITQNFNDQLQAEVQRREALKRYYDDIAYQTINTIQTSTYLTSDNQLNSFILELQSKAIENTNMFNRLLKSGYYGRNTNKYEQDVRSGFTSFINANQNLLYVLKYKVNTISLMLNQNEINEFNETYQLALKCVDKFSFNSDYNSVYFHLNKCLYLGNEKNKCSSLLNFISSACEGNLNKYKQAYKTKKEAKAQADKLIADAKALEAKRLISLQTDVLKRREDFLRDLSKSELKHFLKSEINFLWESKAFSSSGNKLMKDKKTIKEHQKFGFRYKRSVVIFIPFDCGRKFNAINRHLDAYSISSNYWKVEP